MNDTIHSRNKISKTLLFANLAIGSIISSFVLADVADIDRISTKEAVLEYIPANYELPRGITRVALELTHKQELDLDIDIKFSNYESKTQKIIIEQENLDNRRIDNGEITLADLTWKVVDGTMTIGFDKALVDSDIDNYSQELTITLPRTINTLSIPKNLSSKIHIRNDNSPIDLTLTANNGRLIGNYNNLTINNLNKGCDDNNSRHHKGYDRSYNQNSCFRFDSDAEVDRLIVRNMIGENENNIKEPNNSEQSSILLNGFLVKSSIDLYMKEDADVTITITDLTMLDKINWHKNGE